MKKFKYIAYCALGLASTLGLASCEDYLDKEPDTDVKPETAFLNFRNFQGYVEEIYNCIPNKESCYWTTTFNWGEDEILNTGLGDGHLTRQFDLGNYKAWYNQVQSWLCASASVVGGGNRNPNPTSTDKFAHSLVDHAWYCIRKANLGLQNIDKITATREEKNLIAGQLYFFRGWWYEEMMAFFGGLPYMTEPIDASQFNLPRMSYRECADLAAADFRKAADLLPMDWDETTVGKVNKGKNSNRITKAAALGYLGKVLLYAASPLHEKGAQVGASKNGNTYAYNQEYAKKSAEALGELLNLVETTSTKYALAKFVGVYDEEGASIYNHSDKNGKTPIDCYSSLFYTEGFNWRQPGGTEAIMRGPATEVNGSNWNFAKLWGTKTAGIVEHDALIHQPTANYVDYAYGMANGLPITDPESGYDPTHPFLNRDPRFYHDIVFDGFKYIKEKVGADSDKKPYEYCQMYTGGNLRIDNDQASRTGYYTQKLAPHTANVIDGVYNWGSSLSCYLSYMRLAEVYLLYAEAGAAAGGASYKSSNYSKTAEDAINTIRDRVGAAHVNAKYTADKNLFMDEVRRERACELSFEGHRWNDLQRWLLLTEYPYTIKQSAEFSRKESDEFYTQNDPREAEVAGYGYKTILERSYDSKHYFLPFKEADVNLYQGFTQNPGW
ncbi:MAG: RagB/SusD family nutrient uptake outer membrane protein [Bacteroidales bacterium]|nr:RagB/SusD family nutrient uptake outer membrane protein [Bacteroidales bacterium]